MLQKWCPYWNPHPEIPTMIKRDLHGETYPDYFPMILLEPSQMQDDSVNTIQEMPNSQFRLLLSVMPCMPCKDGVNCSAPQYLAPHPPQAQPIRLPVTSPRTSHLPFHLAPLGAKPLPKTIAQNCLALNHIHPKPSPCPYLWLPPGLATPSTQSHQLALPLPVPIVQNCLVHPYSGTL